MSRLNPAKLHVHFAAGSMPGESEWQKPPL